MTKITFTNSLAALDYTTELKKIGFCSVPSPALVKEDRFCRNGNEVYISIKNK